MDTRFPASKTTMPVCHINGTSKRELFDQAINAGQAIRALQEALCDAAPNARDYYPVAGAWKKAQAEHAARLQFLQDMLEHFESQAQLCEVA